MITDILKENNKVIEIILNTENESHIDDLLNKQIELNNNAISLVQDELLSDVSETVTDDLKEVTFMLERAFGQTQYNDKTVTIINRSLDLYNKIRSKYKF